MPLPEGVGPSCYGPPLYVATPTQPEAATRNLGALGGTIRIDDDFLSSKVSATVAV
jgi:hypothetical protein